LWRGLHRPRHNTLVKVILFGATGMVGQGVLRECSLDPGVDQVLSIGRTATGLQHSKLQELALSNLHDFSAISDRLSGFDACFFCLGVSSAGMSEEAYRRVTYDITLAAAETLVRVNRAATFIYVSGQGTDSTAKGRVMWARVKGETENALFRLPFKAAYMFRPGVIQPLHGITSRTRVYRIGYALTAPVLPLLKALFPKSITTTELLGRAMLNVTRRGYPKRILDNADINAAGQSDPSPSPR
jgi:uncharacterized protein YbjT (DUF2867 family)